MRFYGLKSCDTCRKAEKALRAKGVELQVTDVRADGVEAADFSRFLDELGDAVINRKSTTWRQLSETDRVRPPLELLAEHPTLMKRPVIDDGERLYLGWGKEVQDSLLG